MIQFPHCKINLGLSIIEKRADGYHELETVFYPVRLQDMVEACVDEHSTDPIQFSHTGLNIPGDASSNLCIKAFQLLKNSANVHAARYNLRTAILGLGPAGFYFEKYIAKIHESLGFETTTNVS